MTTPPDPSELASALADGLLSGEEAARAAAAPEVAARVEEIHRLRAALREVPPAPELPKARTLAAAVEAGMDAHHQAPGPHGRAGWQPWLAAAAIVAVVVLGVGVFALRDTGDDDVTASSEMAEDSESSVNAADGDGSGGDSETNTGAEAPPPAPGSGEEGEALTDDDGARSASVDLGPVADEEELASAVNRASRSSQAGEPRSSSDQQRPTEGSAAGDSSEEELGLCPQLTAAGDSERGRSTLFATATLAGEPVWVHLYPVNGGEDTALLVATSSACVDVVERIVPTSR